MDELRRWDWAEFSFFVWIDFLSDADVVGNFFFLVDDDVRNR